MCRNLRTQRFQVRITMASLPVPYVKSWSRTQASRCLRWCRRPVQYSKISLLTPRRHRLAPLGGGMHSTRCMLRNTRCRSNHSLPDSHLITRSHRRLSLLRFPCYILLLIRIQIAAQKSSSFLRLSVSFLNYIKFY